MKVLLINNFHYRKGGSETVYFNTGRLLEAHGHQVVWFSFEDEANLPCAQSDYFVKKSASTLGQMKDYFYNGKVRKALERLLEAEKPDIAHVHLLWGGMTPAIFDALRKYNVPLVHTVHDYRMVCPAYTFRNGAGEICEKCHAGSYISCISGRCSKGSLPQSAMMAAEMYSRGLFHSPVKNIDGFIFVSRFCEEKHIEHNKAFAKARRMVLYNSVDVDAPASAARGDYFLYYGRLSYEKGVEDLIRAFSRQGAHKLKIVGTGPVEDSLKALAAGAANIEFLGYRSGEPLFDLVRGCSFVIVPSRWYENN
ncbi:MAG: glycosyltransferase, partial [Bacteroidales bacterium]|nr:glycosyltransferase [Bacteroidales bacterium]